MQSSHFCIIGPVKAFGNQPLGRFWEKNSKKKSKWVDAWGGGRIASRAATKEGGRETERRSWCETPDRLFSPLDTSSLTVWPSTGRAKSRMESAGNRVVIQSVEREPRGMLGREKRLNCALRAFLGAWSRPMRSAIPI